LPTGKYSFRVTASNSDGIWDEKAATLGFSVLPAYYQTNWFRGLVARVSLALVWLAYEWRVRQLRRAYEATLDARVAERTRIARELHDTLLKSFQALALRFQAALNVLPDRPADAEARHLCPRLALTKRCRGPHGGSGTSGLPTQKNNFAAAIRTLGEEGTEVELRVPARAAYLASERPRPSLSWRLRCRGSCRQHTHNVRPRHQLGQPPGWPFHLLTVPADVIDGATSACGKTEATSPVANAGRSPG
jgi:hypothetical protein